MAFNVIALVVLVMGVYVLSRADKQKKSQFKTGYAIAGLVLLLWSLAMFSGIYSIQISALPLIFGLTAVGTLCSKGLTQVIFGALALFVLFSAIA